jgi:hypothetical protein
LLLLLLVVVVVGVVLVHGGESERLSMLNEDATVVAEDVSSICFDVFTGGVVAVVVILFLLLSFAGFS